MKRLLQKIRCALNYHKWKVIQSNEEMACDMCWGCGKQWCYRLNNITHK